MDLPLDTKPRYLFLLPWTLGSCGGVSQVVENLIKQMETHGEYVPLLMVNSWPDKRIRKQTIEDCIHYCYRLRSVWNDEKLFRNIAAYFISLPVELFFFYKFVKSQKATGSRR